MNIMTFYFPTMFAQYASKEYNKRSSEWEVFIDTSGTMTLPFGHCTSQTFVTRPTKKQMRKLKKLHRQEIIKEIERRERNDSWEAIHCDIIGL